jgi:hypothetical protein
MRDEQPREEPTVAGTGIDEHFRQVTAQKELMAEIRIERGSIKELISSARCYLERSCGGAAKKVRPGRFPLSDFAQKSRKGKSLDAVLRAPR